MLSPTLPGRYHIFGVNPSGGHTLFVDYIADDPDRNRCALLERIQCSTDLMLCSWQARSLLTADDVFDIECVGDQRSAQIAVEFWRAYFQALGETVIHSSHLCDSLV